MRLPSDPNVPKRMLKVRRLKFYLQGQTIRPEIELTQILEKDRCPNTFVHQASLACDISFWPPSGGCMMKIAYFAGGCIELQWRLHSLLSDSPSVAIVWPRRVFPNNLRGKTEIALTCTDDESIHSGNQHFFKACIFCIFNVLISKSIIVCILK